MEFYFTIRAIDGKTSAGLSGVATLSARNNQLFYNIQVQNFFQRFACINQCNSAKLEVQDIKISFHTDYSFSTAFNLLCSNALATLQTQGTTNLPGQHLASFNHPATNYNYFCMDIYDKNIFYLTNFDNCFIILLIVLISSLLCPFEIV